jgi:fatty-acyl-CoA synthase
MQKVEVLTVLLELTQSPSYAYTGSEEPLIGETIGKMLDRIARTYPEDEALIYVPRDERYTYREFFDICRKAIWW